MEIFQPFLNAACAKQWATKNESGQSVCCGGVFNLLERETWTFTSTPEASRTISGKSRKPPHSSSFSRGLGIKAGAFVHAGQRFHHSIIYFYVTVTKIPDNNLNEKKKRAHLGSQCQPVAERLWQTSLVRGCGGFSHHGRPASRTSRNKQYYLQSL